MRTTAGSRRAAARALALALLVGGAGRNRRQICAHQWQIGRAEILLSALRPSSADPRRFRCIERSIRVLFEAYGMPSFPSLSSSIGISSITFVKSQFQSSCASCVGGLAAHGECTGEGMHSHTCTCMHTRSRMGTCTRAHALHTRARTRARTLAIRYTRMHATCMFASATTTPRLRSRICCRVLASSPSWSFNTC